MTERVHAFCDDALGTHDAVALAALIRRGELTAEQVWAAAAARAEQVEPALHALALRFPAPVVGAADGPLAGVPTYVKDNTDVRGFPTGNGSAAYVPAPARADAAVTEQLLATGLVALGKTRMPEFGLNATTEFATAEPARNPWDTRYSTGASSGGAAALVAAGVVPLAHANDGGGSIRIPAAACGLVGLRPGRGRLAPNASGRVMPIDLVTDGVVSRSVRDTAAFLVAAERYRRNPALPPIGLVEGPAARRLRIGLVLETPTGHPIDAETEAAAVDTARTLERLGHEVVPTRIDLGPRFVEDFVDYWGMLAWTISVGGRAAFGPTFDAARLDPLTRGLAARYRRAMPRTGAILYRLRRIRQTYAELFTRHDVLLSPVLGHVTPRIGELAPTVPFDELLARLTAYVGFTPLNNVAGGPAIALPTGSTAAGLPVGVHLSAAEGDERTLLELAFAIEAETPWRRIEVSAQRTASLPRTS